MITKATSDDFRGIVNPYTGKEMVVMMNVSESGSVMFFSPDTYSTSERTKSPEECYRLWNRVNGVSGGRSGSPIVCAYTGKPLSVVHTPLGCYFSGGFDPHLFHSREDFLFYATMRGGVPKRPRQTAPVRVTSVPREPVVTSRAKAHAEKAAPRLDEDRVHMVEKSLAPFKDSLPGSSTVSMSINGKKRKVGK